MIMTVQTTDFKCLYVELGTKKRIKSFRLAKVRERKARDLDQVKCIIHEDGKVLVEEAYIR